MPIPVLALPWGSESISNVFLLIADKEVAKLIEVVVYPTPHFWFATEIILTIFIFNIIYFKNTTIIWA